MNEGVVGCKRKVFAEGGWLMMVDMNWSAEETGP
jgi:hypothetical protein